MDADDSSRAVRAGQAEGVRQRAAAGGEPKRREGFPSDAKVTVKGDDCPIPFAPAIAPDFEAVTMTFSDNMLTAEQRSFRCQIGIDYKFPAGWRFWRPAASALGIQSMGDGDRMVWAIRDRLNGGAWASENKLTEGPVQEDLEIKLKGGEELGERPTACGATSAHIDAEIFGALFVGPAGPIDELLGTLDSFETLIDWERCP